MKTKESVYAYVNSMLTQKAGTVFKSMSDTFTSSVGLDIFLTDLQDQELRPTVLRTFSHLMAHNDEVCVKILKLKLVSNVLTHFVVDASPESVDVRTEVKDLLLTVSKCKHWGTLLTKSEQFKPEKKRLELLASSTQLDPELKDQLQKMLKSK